MVYNDLSDCPLILKIPQILGLYQLTKISLHQDQASR